MSEQKFTPISEITDETVVVLRRRTALSLPDDPQAAGMRAATVKRRFWEGMVGDRASLLEEQRRIVREANAAMEQLGEAVDLSVTAAQAAAQKATKEYTDEVVAQLENAIGLMDGTAVGAEETATAAREAANAARLAAETFPDMVAEAVGMGGLRGHTTGAAIGMPDVSPIEHTMKVKVSSDTVADLSAVKVKRIGKNLLNINEDALNSNLSKNPSGRVDIYNVPHGTYMLSVYITKYAEDLATNTRVTCRVMYKDGTKGYFDTKHDTENAERDGVPKKKCLKITTNTEKDIDYFILYLLDYGSQNSARKARIDNAQLELSAIDTDYEPYQETVYTPNVDGVVDGVTSLYPSTTLVSDTEGVVIKAEYARDTNKAFAELYGMIANLM